MSEYKIPDPPIELSSLSKEQLDNLLGKLGQSIEAFFHYNLGKNCAFIIGVGEPGGYRGTVTNLVSDFEKLGNMIIGWGENIKKGRNEW